MPLLPQSKSSPRKYESFPTKPRVQAQYPPHEGSLSTKARTPERPNRLHESSESSPRKPEPLPTKAQNLPHYSPNPFPPTPKIRPTKAESNSTKGQNFLTKTRILSGESLNPHESLKFTPTHAQIFFAKIQGSFPRKLESLRTSPRKPEIPNPYESRLPPHESPLLTKAQTLPTKAQPTGPPCTLIKGLSKLACISSDVASDNQNHKMLRWRTRAQPLKV